MAHVKGLKMAERRLIEGKRRQKRAQDGSRRRLMSGIALVEPSLPYSAFHSLLRRLLALSSLLS